MHQLLEELRLRVLGVYFFYSSHLIYEQNFKYEILLQCVFVFLLFSSYSQKYGGFLVFIITDDIPLSRKKKLKYESIC